MQKLPHDDNDAILLRWQLYYNGKSNGPKALELVQEGVASYLSKHAYQSKERCQVFQIKESKSDWHCIRLEFLTFTSIGFKKVMKETVTRANNASLTTVQPKQVHLYSCLAPQPVYNRDLAGLKRLDI